MKVALFQSDIEWCNKEKNFSVAKEKIKEAKEKGCSVIFFPEMSFTGFSMATELTAEDDRKTLDYISSLAKEYKMYIGFGYVKKNEKCENHYAVVDYKGNVISDYIKIHPFSAGYENEHFVGGTDVTRYRIEGINFSTFICYDLRFPEIFSAVSNTAEVIVIPANWPKSRSHHWKTLLKARSIENQCYILGVNCVGVHDDIYYSGDTMAVNPDGEILAERSNIQDLVIVEINKDTDTFKEKFDSRLDRRPELYKEIL